ncbi:MAG: pseudaminic acid synthase [Candidatus Thermoplasmatota archaeon]|nr:pseudaminic acid synthase [Candidatus Thermoplasmatota archaeon]
MQKEVTIGQKIIGSGHPTYIIAEIGANHNRDLATAKQLIDNAVEAGVDCIKFQTYRAETMYSKHTPKFSKDEVNPFDLIKANELPREWHRELFDYVTQKDLHFLSSPFDYNAVDELDTIGVPAFKVASFELTDLELLKYIAQKHKPILLSVGLATLGEIEDALEVIRSQGNDDIIILHCASLYPSPPEIVNLKAIETLSKAFQIPIGFSDHTLGIHISTAAVAQGATVIEKHFTLDRTMKGPDHSFAIEPDELNQLVKNIRDVEQAMGTGVKERSKAEQEMYEKGRRSIIAAVDIKKGTIITKDMLVVKRPGYGLKPKYLHMVIGRSAKRDIKADEWITKDMI